MKSSRVAEHSERRTVMKTTMQKPTTPALSSCMRNVARSNPLYTTSVCQRVMLRKHNAPLAPDTLRTRQRVTQPCRPDRSSAQISRSRQPVLMQGQGLPAHRGQVLGEAQGKHDDDDQEQHDPAAGTGREERRRRAHQLQTEGEALRGARAPESDVSKPKQQTIVLCGA